MLDSGGHSLTRLRSVQGHEIRVHRQAGRLAFLGMKLAGRQVVAPDDGRERIGIIGLGGDVIGI